MLKKWEKSDDLTPRKVGTDGYMSGQHINGLTEGPTAFR